MLYSRLRADFRVYMKGVQRLETAALKRGSDENFDKLLNDANVARKAFMEARRKLNEHIASHVLVQREMERGRSLLASI